MNAAHTAGPWCLDGEDQGQHALLGVYIAQDSETGGRIAQTFANCLVTTDDECRANARLIAAAPELLEACRAVLVGVDPDCGDPDCEDCAWARPIRAAIAKAEVAES